MKLNPKVYKAIKGEPFKTQNIDGIKIEFFYMEDTPFLNEYAGKGRFALWTSDGNNYRVIVEKTYYDALENFYDEPINAIWIDFLARIGKLTSRMRLFFTVPLMIVYIIVAAVSTIYFQEHLVLTLVIMLIVVIGSNMFRAQLLNRKAHAENSKAQEEIRNHLGKELFEEMVAEQEKHYKSYFNFDDENEVETSDEILDTEEIVQEEKPQEGDDNDSKID